MNPRKAIDFAVLLVVAGVALLLPPLILIFNQPLVLFGIPLPALYVFGVWLLLLVGAVVLARLLPREEE